MVPAALLYSLHITPHPHGFGKPCVRAIPATIVGTDEATGDIWKPDPDSVRMCLPHQWRKARDRSGGNFWYDKAGGMPDIDARGVARPAPYLVLRSAKGRTLGTLYAIPYRYRQEV